MIAYAPTPSPQAAPTTTARLTTIFGSNSSSLIDYRKLLQDDAVVIVIDVPGEIAKLKEKLQHPNLIFVELGESQTARSLVSNASPELQSRIERTPGISSVFGMAQLRAMGGCATQQYLDSSKFTLLIQNEVVPRLLKRYAAIRDVYQVVHEGGSGGTGSLGGLLFSEAVAAELRFRLGVVVSTHFHITAGVTTVDLGRFTRHNAVANIVDVADRMVHSAEDDGEAWSVIFRENLAVGTDRAKRDQYVLMADQALAASEVERELLLRAPNQAGRDRCGNMSTLQFGFGQPLHPRFDVAPDNARNLHREVQRVLATPAQPVVLELNTPTEEVELPQEPAAHLVERVWDSDPEEWLEAATQPGIDAAAGAIALLASGVLLNLLDTRRQCAVPPRTGTEAAARLGVLRSCLLESERCVEHARAELMDSELRLAYARRRLVWALGLVHPRSILHWPFALLTTVRYKERRLTKAIEQYRELDCERIVAAAQLAALENAHDQLETEHAYLEARLQQISGALERFLYRGEANRSRPLVTTLPLDEVFSDFWQLLPRDSDERVLKAICGATHQVTIDGLAKITKASEPRLDLIARQVASRRFVELGPAWGGSPRGLEPLCIHVLPPLDPDMAQTLRGLIRDLDNSIVCVADTAAAAVTFVDLYLEPVREIRDLLPGYYASALIEIVNSPNWPLFFPDGLDVLKRLGIEVQRESLIFHPLD